MEGGMRDGIEALVEGEMVVVSIRIFWVGRLGVESLWIREVTVASSLSYIDINICFVQLWYGCTRLTEMNMISHASTNSSGEEHGVPPSSFSDSPREIVRFQYLNARRSLCFRCFWMLVAIARPMEPRPIQPSWGGGDEHMIYQVIERTTLILLFPGNRGVEMVME